MPNIYEQLIQFNNNNNKKPNNPVLKNGHKKWIDISLKTYRWPTGMKRGLKSLIIRGMQIRTTMKYHLTSVRIAMIRKKNRNNKYWQGWGEKVNFSTVGGNTNKCIQYGKWYGFSKLNIELPHDPVVLEKKII